MKRQGIHLIVVAAIELLTGLGLSLWVGTHVSWTSAALLGLSFFVSANVLFWLGFKKL